MREAGSPRSVPLTVALGVLAVMAATARADETTLFKPYYFVAYGGAAITTGTVDDIAGLVEFPPVEATAIYDDGGVAVGLQIGRRHGAWISELAMEGRPAIPLTDLGQSLANRSRIDGKEVDVEWISFDLFVGRSFAAGERLAPFVGIANGLAIQQLSAGRGEEPFNDEGYSLAAKAGVDWIAYASTWNLLLRPGVRYQIATAGVAIPREWVFFLGLGVGVGI